MLSRFVHVFVVHVFNFSPSYCLFCLFGIHLLFVRFTSLPTKRWLHANDSDDATIHSRSVNYANMLTTNKGVHTSKKCNPGLLFVMLESNICSINEYLCDLQLTLTNWKLVDDVVVLYFYLYVCICLVFSALLQKLFVCLLFFLCLRLYALWHCFILSLFLSELEAHVCILFYDL